MKKPLFYILTFIFILTSCSTGTGDDFEILQSEITQITCPVSAISNNEVKIRVQFPGVNGCSEAYDIKANKVGQTITLSAYYKQPDLGECTEIYPSFELDYTFFADLPGTYFFVSEMNPNIADTLVVY